MFFTFTMHYDMSNIQKEKNHDLREATTFNIKRGGNQNYSYYKI